MALTPNYNIGLRQSVAADPSVDADTKKALRNRPVSTDSPFMGGVPLAASMANASGTVNNNIAATTAPVPAGAPQLRDNIGQANLAALDNLGARLAPGVKRYNMDPGNEAQVYVTRGKDGSTIFTDDAGFAAKNSAGGLRRGDVNANVLSRTQGDRNDYEYAKSTLAQQGLRRQDFQVLDPDKARDALITATAGGDAQTEQGLSDRIDANVLRGRIFAADKAAQAAQAGLTARDQINMFRAQSNAQLGAQRNAIEQGNADRANRADQRKGLDDLLTQYNALKTTDPGQANQLITARLNRIGSDPSYANTDEGRFVKTAFLNDVLRPGAQRSLHGIEWGDSSAVPGLGYGNIAVDGSGNFQGFKDDEGSLQYPLRRGGLSRFFSTNRSLFGKADNYDGSVYDVSPETWRALYGADNPPPKQK